MSVKVKDRHISKQHCLYKARDLMGYILVLTRPREFDKDGKQICNLDCLERVNLFRRFGLDIIKCGKGIHACCYEASKINLKDKDTLTRRNEYHNKPLNIVIVSFAKSISVYSNMLVTAIRKEDLLNIQLD